MHTSIKLLFQDNDIAVIYKSPGLLSVPYPHSTEKNACDELEHLMRKNGTWTKNHRPFAVHRLDRETSGIMMFALNQKACNIISDTWQTMVTQRLYHAIGENPQPDAHFPKLPDNGIINLPLTQNKYHQSYVPREQDLRIKKIKQENAVTHFKILKANQNYTLFELELETGRKNQIRAHLAYFGYPLAGDKNYRAKTNPLGTLALHARSLGFVHPFTKEPMYFEQEENSRWKNLF